MKRIFLLLALRFQPAPCAQEAVDAAALQLALQSQHLEAWIESVAARRQISKHAVRSNLQAITYHLDPVSQDPASREPGSAAGGEDAHLERRQPGRADYPEIYGYERLNDHMTNHRLSTHHIICRRDHAQPPGSPYVPNFNIRSFWRGGSGLCLGNLVLILCKLPTAFAPPNWREDVLDNVRAANMTCPPDYRCTTFSAHNFAREDVVSWGGCTQMKPAAKVAMVNNVPVFSGKIPCPVQPGKTAEWDMYGQTTDGRALDWTFFSGRAKEPVKYSRSPDFMLDKIVEWRGSDPDRQPWLKFTRMGQAATIHLYSHLA